MPRRTARLSLLAPAGFATAALIVGAGSAEAVSLSVQRACMGDYLAHCSQHSIGSAAVRGCMSKVGPRLSNRCVNALVAAGEVSKTEVSRRRSASQ